MNRVNCYCSTSMMTPCRELAGRFMRAPDHPTGDDWTGGDSGVPGDNTGLIPVSPKIRPTGEDNDGQPLELTKFWDG
jgi:hypothetical protein